MVDILFASFNRAKHEQVEKYCGSLGVNIVKPWEHNIQDVEETALTFVENALIKARNGARNSSFGVLAEDSGLCVPVLEGAPGLYSARYAGSDCITKDNINLLLKNLLPYREGEIKAYFYCVMVYLRSYDDPSPIIVEGVLDGWITSSPRGDGNHGYDPIFFVDCYGKTLAQITLEEKNAISHRGKALKEMMDKLLAELS